MQMTLKEKDNTTLFPVFWDDNYVSLLPGDSRTYRCKLPDRADTADELSLFVSGWNVKEQQIRINFK